MIINAIRWRGRAQEDWQAYKLSLGAGRFRNYQCVTASPEALRPLAAALDYALTGHETAPVAEVSLQLSDDAGNTWVVHRRPGTTKLLKNGTALTPETAESALAAALMDIDGLDGATDARLTLGRFEIRTGDDGLRLGELGAPESAMQTLKDVAARQLAEIAAECARTLGLPQLAEPKALTRLARLLEPLHAGYRELCKQYTELKEEASGFSEKDLASMQSLASEIEALAELEETAAPLLAPGVSMKALRDELAKADADIAEICNALGIDSPDGRTVLRDFRKPIEALSRLEAHAKLIRASQGARKYCEQNIEPLYQRYFDTAETGLVADRQIVSELESCLASLTLRLRPRDAGEAPLPEGGLKTWFDRFKSRSPDDGKQDADPQQGAIADIDTARMAIEYALNRLNELGSGVTAAREKHDSALGRIDEAHEELVRNFARIRDHWLLVARECHLPDELDLNGLLRIAAHHGRLTALSDLRQELAQKIRRYSQRLQKVEQLLHGWRKATGSQKNVDLSNPNILLAEVQGVLRYHEAKRKRFEQLSGAAGEAKAALAIRGLLKSRRKALMTGWKDAFTEAGVPPLEIHDDRVDEMFKRAGIVKALAIIHGSTSKSTPTKLFDSASEASAASIYLWSDARTDNKHRLALLQQLEDAHGGELRLLLLGDESLAAMLAPLGVGMATRITLPAGSPKPAAKQDAPRQEAPRQEPPRQEAKRPGATPVMKPGPGSQRAPTPPTASLLNERAMRTLELLAVKKP